ncbi:lysine methyltransferase [Nitzschia inconspicua]|uniref:Lysine methyltransferase n=1 Tax=Nitzschia inconspicua TaxID=303405 RepID=A0A9K3LFW2_9STRA|nr:lysine methyltransferase [Nitzschia inconspicua]
MDLQKLLDDGIITKDTFEWLVPLLQQEVDDLREVQDARNSNHLFSIPTAEETETNNNNGDEDGLMLSKETIHNLEGITFSFWMDVGSAGHGNRVWHSSIAMCLYLKRNCQEWTVSQSSSSPSSSSTWCSLELGAGTALPSLYLGHLLSQENTSSPCFLHITDGKQYRNVRQILYSVSKQPSNILQRSLFRVSPHNWGESLEMEENKSTSFLLRECQRQYNSYDLILVSDCIYNPQYHKDLLKTIAATLRLPRNGCIGGKAVISFSLHGNTPDQDIWTFIDHTIPGLHYGDWRLTATPVDHELSTLLQQPQVVEGRQGWDMEEIMKDMGLWTAHMEPKRWFSYLYEVTWMNKDRNS